jgi:transketolase
VRNAFAAALTECADADPSVVLLSGDIGNRLFDKYKERHRNRFLNCGVAEANMTGVAAGLALSGLRPITYTITPFVTTRCLEQIRVDLCYHHLPVTIVGVGAGLSYASLGATHHACEDIAFMRALPGMTVLCPADAHEVRGALRAALELDGPCYIRMGKKGEPVVHESEPDFTIGESIVLRPGRHACMLATGTMVWSALEARDRLAGLGIDLEVVSFHSVKPLDTETLERVSAEYPLLVTLEEHSLIGGLGSAVAEWLADRAVPTDTRLLRLGTKDHFPHEAGGQEHARKFHGLDVDSITRRIAHACESQAVGLPAS